MEVTKTGGQWKACGPLKQTCHSSKGFCVSNEACHQLQEYTVTYPKSFDTNSGMTNYTVYHRGISSSNPFMSSTYLQEFLYKYKDNLNFVTENHIQFSLFR